MNLYFAVWHWNTEVRMFVVLDMTEDFAREQVERRVGEGGKIDIQELPFDDGWADLDSQIMEVRM